ncbi:O-acyltransferase like protein-like [Battus philenor]|uniref:O-acyltransferase like protein-like n=1 Tax=Battus philenor TaxID=42288 RepID=UPI0035CE9AAC
MHWNSAVWTLSVAFSILTVVSGSIIQLNETAFASLPPLYALDEWTQCQGPDHVYCIVDAALVSKTQSPLLQLLKDYSSQNLKHYNRTVVHRGVCVSSCGQASGDGDWKEAAQLCVNRSLLQYGLEAEVMSANWCSSAKTVQPTSGSRFLAVYCIALVVISVLATGLHILGDCCTTVEGNKYLLAFSLKRNWEILKYDRSKPRSDDRMKNLTAIEGIRFLGIQCVIFSHVIWIYVYSYIDNPQYIEKMYDNFVWKMVLNSPLWLQVFFSLSGFLTSYAVLISTDSNPITFVKCLVSIINRWIRLTPVAVFALWFTMSWFPLLGSGPQWAWLVRREAEDCSQRWWYHLFYAHNHLSLGKMCMGHTWYLAADMQLHVVGVMVILLMVRCKKSIIPVLSLLLVISSVAAGFVTFFYELTPIITAQPPELLRNLFGGSKILPLLYLPIWMNLAGYFCGVSTAFILHYNQTNAINLAENKLFNLLFHASLTLGGGVVMGGVVFLSDTPPPHWVAAVYAALDRTLVAIFFNIFMLGCFSRCKSLLRNLLEWRGFHILGRLSYCAYVIHFIILRLTLAGNTQLGHPTILSMISVLITSSVLTYVISVPLCLLVELPAIQLWKAVTGSEMRERQPPPTLPPPQDVLPTNQKFDLVAHIRRSVV